MSQIQSETSLSRKGYQVVQIGPEQLEIPEEWTVTTVDDAALKFISGGTPDSDNEDYWGGRIPWTTCAVVEGPQFDGQKDFITQEGLDSSSASLVPEGSILFGTRVNVANVGRTTREIAISQDLTGIILDEERIDPNFATWYLLFNQSKIRDRYSQGSTIQGMITSDLKALPLLSPPLPEQRRIADILSTVNEQIQQTDEIITENKNTKRGIIQNLYDTNRVERGANSTERSVDKILKRRRETWLESEKEKKIQASDGSDVDPSKYDPPLDLLFSSRLPDLPEGWQWISLDTLVAYDIDYRGKTPPYSDSGIPVISSGNIQEGEIATSEERYVSSETYDEWLTRGVPREGDLIITTEAPVGKVAIYPEGKHLPTRRVIVLRTVGVDNMYLHAALSHPKVQSYLLAQSGGSTVGRILKDNLLRTPIPLPPKKEESRLTKALTNINQKISIEEKQKEDLQELKRGLMQDLLTGTVRVDPGQLE